MAFCLLMVGNLPLSLHQRRGFFEKGAWISYLLVPMRLEKQKRLGFDPFPEKWKGQGLWLTSYSDSRARKIAWWQCVALMDLLVPLMHGRFAQARWSHPGEGAARPWKEHIRGLPKGHLETVGLQRKSLCREDPKNQVMRGRF